jgi:thiol:disulfide interchange protein
LIALAAVLLAGAPPSEAQEPTSDPIYVVDHYDAARDPGADLLIAERRAADQHRRILVILGGDWCGWCRYLAEYLPHHPSVHEAFAASFVVLKINVSPENANTAFTRRYPRATGYPFFLVLNSDGSFAGAQSTAPLGNDETYYDRRMIQFAERWGVR